jgi:hypothetical protein
MTPSMRLPFAATLAALSLLAPSASATKLKVPSQFPTIQAAVDAAQPGDEVRIQGGLYLEEVVVADKTDLTIKAQGALITGGFGGFAFTVKDSTGVLVRGLTISDSAGDGILAKDVSGLTLWGCKVFDSAFSGITLWDCSDVVIKKCRVERATDHGIDIGGIGHGCNNVTVLKTKVRDVAGDGIWLNGDTFLVKSCRLIDVTDVGIGQANGSLLSSATIEKNVIKSLEQGDEADVGYGIYVRGLNIKVIKNKVKFPQDGTAIKIEGMDITAQGNKITGGSTGILVANLFGTVATGMKVLDNVIKKPEYRGVDTTQDVLGAIIQGNKVISSGRDGLIIWGTACQVIANTIKKAAWYGVEAPDGANTYTGNVATGSGKCDLYNHQQEGSSTNILDGNLFPVRCYGS